MAEIFENRQQTAENAMPVMVRKLSAQSRRLKAMLPDNDLGDGNISNTMIPQLNAEQAQRGRARRHMSGRRRRSQKLQEPTKVDFAGRGNLDLSRSSFDLRQTGHGRSRRAIALEDRNLDPAPTDRAALLRRVAFTAYLEITALAPQTVVDRLLAAYGSRTARSGAFRQYVA